MKRAEVASRPLRSPPPWTVSGTRAADLHRAMVVAMVAVRMMQVAVDKEVDMVAVRHGLVAAARPVPVALIVTGADVIGRAGAGIAGAHLEDMLVDMAAVRVMEMAVVQIVDVITMLDRSMAAGWAMLVRVVGVNLVVVR